MITNPHLLNPGNTNPLKEMSIGQTNKSWKGALLVSGEPGTGKSRWIRDEATTAKAKLFRWNARTDRSLREGREILHQQVRSKERMFVWIEGVDDLTQEAQAFLRRILETAAPNVTCALEVRELWRLSPPILSRCTIIPMRAETSYRAIRNRQMAARLGIGSVSVSVSVSSNGQNSYTEPTLNWQTLVTRRNAGEDPYVLIESLATQKGWGSTHIREMIRAIGAGSSPWIQLAAALLK